MRTCAESRSMSDAKRANSAPKTNTNFFQIIDKLERTPKEEAEKKLSALGFSLADVNEFIEAGKPTAELETILQNLAARGLGDFVKIDYHVIRGLAYYTGVVFEAFDRRANSAPSPAADATTISSSSSAAAKWICPRSASAWATWCCWNSQGARPAAEI